MFSYTDAGWWNEKKFVTINNFEKLFEITFQQNTSFHAKLQWTEHIGSGEIVRPCFFLSGYFDVVKVSDEPQALPWFLLQKKPDLFGLFLKPRLFYGTAPVEAIWRELGFSSLAAPWELVQCSGIRACGQI